MKSLGKIILVLLVSASILITGFFVVSLVGIFIAFGGLDNSSKEELVENYRNKKQELLQLKQYFNSIVPQQFEVYIEYKDDNEIDLWVFEKVDTVEYGRITWFREWDINPYHYESKPLTSFDSSEYAPKTKSLDLIKQKLHWNDDTFREIKTYLDKADCISIENGEPAKIGYARSGMGKYLYNLFDKPITDSLKSEWNDSCTYIYYNNRLVLEYGGGAIGSQCFPDK